MVLTHAPNSEDGMADSTKTMSGKTAVVTGATAGIGEVAARELARMGARVVLVGRSREKAEATAAMIRREAGDPEVEYFLADLSSQAEIRRLAEEIKARHPRIDVLINNAGAMITPRQESVDGIEMTWALNHMGYFLLTSLLLDTLRASAPSRVVSVSSDAHRTVSGIHFDDVEGKKGYRPLRAYSQSKLANVLFTRELSRRLEGSGVTANSLHPGVVATRFSSGEGFSFWVLRQATRLLGISPERGAETTIYLASSPDVEGATGGYYTRSRPVKPAAAAQDDEAARRLWALSETIVGAGGVVRAVS